MKLPRKTLEKKLFKSGYRLIYAVDEVGMGCLAGPVVVCVVAFTKKFFAKRHRHLEYLRDSKLLSSYQREEYARKLVLDKNIKYQLAFAYPKTIDNINIYNAARATMLRAINKLRIKHYELKKQSAIRSTQSDNKSIVLVDGRTKIKTLNMEQLAIVKGDRKILAIACASIIAKVHRDKMMVRYAKKYPGYGLEKHKGYGTKYHQTKLIELGPSAIHRKSFAPVAKLL